MTTKMTAGVDVTGRPSLVEDCQRGRPAHSVHTSVYRVWKNEGVGEERKGKGMKREGVIKE